MALSLFSLYMSQRVYPCRNDVQFIYHRSAGQVSSHRLHLLSAELRRAWEMEISGG